MPQMSPLLWTLITISTISLLLIISSFLYFMIFPSTIHIYFHRKYYSSFTFKWMW